MTPSIQQALRGVDVLPPGEAYDYDYFQAKLGDDQLLARSVAVRVYRMPFLAVPIGRVRRGGFFTLQDLACAEAVREALQPLNGFPALRTAWVASPLASPAVEWGDHPPLRWDNEAQRLAFYGLTRPAGHTPCTSLFASHLLFPHGSVGRRRGPIVPARALPRGRASCLGTFPLARPLTRVIA